MENFPTEIRPLGTSYLLVNLEPSGQSAKDVHWPQGEFYFNDQKRTATITDVKFLSENLLVVANRANAMVHLIEINEGCYEVLDSLKLRTSDAQREYFHPDLMALSGNVIYMTEYTSRCCVVDIVENKLVFNTIFSIGRVAYHGCYATDQHVFLGTVAGGEIAQLDTATKSISSLRTGIDANRRIKTIGKAGNNFILGLDTQSGDSAYPGSSGESWVVLCKPNATGLEVASSIKFTNSQIDGYANHDNYHFFTLHDGDLKCGKILVIKTTKERITLHRTILCDSFPHGIDIYKNFLAYTLYSNSSVVVHRLSELIPIQVSSRIMSKLYFKTLQKKAKRLLSKIC